MAKYIDAAAFAGGTLTSSESQLRFREMTGQEAYFEFLRMVNDAPAADVAPVVHGRWVWNEECYTWDCTNCNGFVGSHSRISAYVHCPLCGARMDLGGADNG